MPPYNATVYPPLSTVLSSSGGGDPTTDGAAGTVNATKEILRASGRHASRKGESRRSIVSDASSSWRRRTVKSRIGSGSSSRERSDCGPVDVESDDGLSRIDSPWWEDSYNFSDNRYGVNDDSTYDDRDGMTADFTDEHSVPDWDYEDDEEEDCEASKADNSVIGAFGRLVDSIFGSGSACRRVAEEETVTFKTYEDYRDGNDASCHNDRGGGGSGDTADDRKGGTDKQEAPMMSASISYIKNVMKVPSLRSSEGKTSKASTLPVSPPRPKPAPADVDYDVNPTTLYQLIEARDWDAAAARASYYPEEAKTWIYRRERLWDDDDVAGGEGKYVEIGEAPPASSGCLQHRWWHNSIRWRILPLHAACIFRAPRSVVDALIAAHPDSPLMRDDRSKLPLHLACHAGSDRGAILSLLNAFPDSATMRDGKGRTAVTIARASDAYGGREDAREGAIRAIAMFAGDERVEATPLLSPPPLPAIQADSRVETPVEEELVVLEEQETTSELGFCTVMDCPDSAAVGDASADVVTEESHRAVANMELKRKEERDISVVEDDVGINDGDAMASIFVPRGVGTLGASLASTHTASTGGGIEATLSQNPVPPQRQQRSVPPAPPVAPAKRSGGSSGLSGKSAGGLMKSLKLKSSLGKSMAKKWAVDRRRSSSSKASESREDVGWEGFEPAFLRIEYVRSTKQPASSGYNDEETVGGPERRPYDESVGFAALVM